MKRHILSLLACAAIATASLIPIPETPLDDVSFIDKWTHIVMYACLSGILWWECRRTCSLVRLLLVCVLLPSLYGGLMELAQSYLTTYRYGDWLDVSANCTGVVLVSLPLTLRRTALCKRNRVK